MIPQSHRRTPPFHPGGCTCAACRPAAPADRPASPIDMFVLGAVASGIGLVIVMLLRMIVPPVLRALGAS